MPGSPSRPKLRPNQGRYCAFLLVFTAQFTNCTRTDDSRVGFARVGAFIDVSRFTCSTNSLAEIAISRGQAASSVEERSTSALAVTSSALGSPLAISAGTSSDKTGMPCNCTVAFCSWQRTVQRIAGVTAMPSVLSSIAKSSPVTAGLIDEQSTKSTRGSAPSAGAGPHRNPSITKTVSIAERVMTIGFPGIWQMRTRVFVIVRFA